MDGCCKSWRSCSIRAEVTCKTCSRCGVEKPRTEFYAKPSRKDGLRSECKACSKSEAKNWSDANKDRVKARSEKAHAKNREKRLEQMLAWRNANKASVAEYNKVNSKAFRIANPEYMKAYLKRYRTEINPAAVARSKISYRTARKSQVVEWADDVLIDEAYRLAALRSQMTGIKWEVDHIVPLSNPLVCGLHVEHNLQVIPMIENRIKGNRHWPHMP